MLRIVCCSLLICIGLYLLTGCNTQESVATPIGSNIWQETPTFAYGVWETEKLGYLPWNSGRCEATSFDTFAETDLGYYTSFMGSLYYMEKANSGQWLPVCSKPNCNHSSTMTCNANVQPSNRFIVAKNRIYYVTMEALSLQFNRGTNNVLLISMAPDGTDRQLDYSLELPDHSRTLIFLLTPECLLCNVVTLNPDGTSTSYAYRITERGQHTILKRENHEGDVTISDTAELPLWGDRVYLNGILDESFSTYFDFSGETVGQVYLKGMPLKGSYLSNKTLRFFRKDDGYYDRNIQTGEEVKLEDAQLHGSDARVVLPNCVIESTLFCKNHTGEHSMVIYDGTSWRTVELPNELRSGDFASAFAVKAITSEHILFSLYHEDNSSNGAKSCRFELYSIALNSNHWSLEYHSSVGN